MLELATHSCALMTGVFLITAAVMHAGAAIGVHRRWESWPEWARFGREALWIGVLGAMVTLILQLIGEIL